ncbi:alpha/beta hydrolase family protein [Actinomyces howellii]|uniref:Acetoin dehydrogenase E2 subunit dihydrolipoyllysine-residue acetyltransferase n=1 Tax=Actinomyces howellii TaxID=52771 RepID=A0A448HFS7_9ACTO|nr:alpha/beta fold hydrolase [Actinomyces howellii]VEG27381.1 acetoin dehydrogenase E2 subunit dihydrolipoyllysine-residue acetyltransferase [Actinomyces howellii]
MNDYLAREMSAPVAGAPDPAGLGPAVQALVYVPREAAAGRVRAPLVVCCHGLGESGLRVAPVAQRLAAAGAVAVCPTFRGGGAPTAGETTGMSVLTELADLEAVLAAAWSWPFVDTGRTALFGRSLGGLVAVLAAARRPAQVAALVLWYPALRAPAGLRARFSTPAAVPDRFSHGVDDGQMVLGRRYAQDMWGLDVEAQLAALRRPVLLVHGDRDRAVPIEVSEAALRTLTDARLIRVAGAGHGFGDERFELAVTASTDFLSWAGVLED